MSQWEDRKDELIRKLEKSKMTFRDILAQDKDYLVFTPQDREELESLLQRNDKVLSKLKKGEFTVAIVGLEKAGKSTLGNALLKNMILPEYTERCTYTTTEIRAGSETRGEIVFYSREEFQTHFQKMMVELGYEGTAAIDTPVETFNSWWDTMADKDRRTYDQLNGTIAEDVR
ncbi:dynamin family protein, partial [uncultured Selenomonas sp.]